MGSDWTEVSLSELTTKITKGTTPTKKDGGFSSEGVNYIKSEAVTFDGRIDESKFTFISSEIHKKLKRSQLEESDILMSMAGIHLGKTAIVRTRHLPANTNQALALIRPIRNKIYPDYLFYFLQQSSVVYFINNSTSQSAQPNINLQEIGSLNIKYPEYNEQKAIAHILGSLDDKIELNRQMNETLEAMAQALFKSWFVDFDPVIDNALAAGNAIPDELLERAEQRKAIEKKNHSEIQSLFPDEFEFTEEMGWIPKGWAIRNLSEMVSVIIDHRGKTPKKLGGDWAESGYPAISAKNIKGNKLVRPDTIRFVDKDIYDKWMKVPLEVGDVIMTSEAPLGELYYLNSKIDYLLSQRLYAIRADKINCTGSYLFYWFQTEFGSAEIQNRATGTTVFGIKQSELRKVLVLCPPSSVLENFDKYSQGLLGKMDANDLSSTELTKLRDTLLPKLMSGELRIPDAAAFMDEVK